MANSILFCLALVLLAVCQKAFSFHISTPLKTQLKVIRKQFSATNDDKTPETITEKPRAETLADAYIPPPSIEPSVITVNDPQVKSGVPKLPTISLNELQISSIFGSTLTGLILGGLSDFTLPPSIEPWIAPVLGSLWFGGGSFLIEQSEFDQAKDVVQKVFGNPTLNLKNKIQTAIINKKNEVVNGIKAIPNNVKLAILASINKAQRKVEQKITEAVDKVLESPRAYVNEIKRNIDNKINEVKTAIQNQVDEILAGPRELQKNIANSVESITNPPPPPVADKKKVETEESETAVNAIKRTAEVVEERPKVAARVAAVQPAKKVEKVVVKAEPVAVQKPPSQPAKPAQTPKSAVTEKKPEVTPAPATPKTASSTSSPFQFNFASLGSYSKGTSSVTTKVTAAAASKPVEKAPTPPVTVTKQPAAAVASAAPVKSAPSTGGFLSFLASSPQETPAPAKPAAAASKEKIASAPIAAAKPVSPASSKPATTGGFLSFLASSPEASVPPAKPAAPANKPATTVAKAAGVKAPVAQAKSASQIEEKKASSPASSPNPFFSFSLGGKASSSAGSAPKAPTATSTAKASPAATTTKPVEKAAEKKASSAPFSFSFGGKPTAATTTAATQETKPAAVPKTTTPAKPLFSTGSVKSAAPATPTPAKVTTNTAPSKPVFSTGSVKTSTTTTASNNNKTPAPAAPSLLSATAVKTLKGYGVAEAAISVIDGTAQQFISGKTSARQLYAVVLSEVKTKDRANNALADIIGSLPKGEKKLELNQYYQQIA